MLNRIKELATTLEPRLIEIRRHIHSHPELSGQEHQTAAYVASVLSSCDLHVREAIGKTGIVGDLKVVVIIINGWQFVPIWMLCRLQNVLI